MLSKGAIPPYILKEAAIAESVAIGIDLVVDLGGEQRNNLSPSCGDVIWELREGDPFRYRYHAVDMFTAKKLQECKRQELEDTL